MGHINKIARLITEDPDLFLESENLERDLKWLEDEYFDQSIYFQKKDLVKINKLREQLGMPQVDANLKPISTEPEPKLELPIKPEAKPAPKAPTLRKPLKDTHAEARAAYEVYLQKEEMLKPHRAYNNRMIRATAPRNGRTPIEPLATMGTDGDEILCDFCKKGIIVEGGKFHGMTAKQAWGESNGKLDYSYISGGVVFLTEENGTFRAYHGYSRRGDCDTKAGEQETLKRKKFNSTKELPMGILKKVKVFLAEEGLDEGLASKIISANYDYDPGIGVNQP